LENKLASSGVSTVPLSHFEEDIIEELADYNRRSNNLIFYNIFDKVDGSSSNENRKINFALAIVVIQVIIPDGVPISKIMRFDCQKNGHLRPLRVILFSKEDAISILRNKVAIRSSSKYTKIKHLSSTNILMI